MAPYREAFSLRTEYRRSVLGLAQPAQNPLACSSDSTSSAVSAAGLKFAQSFELFLDRATLQFDAGTYGEDWVVKSPLTLITDEGEIETPDPGGSGEWCAAFTDELQAAVMAVQSGEAPTVLSGELARDALKLCHAEAESIRTGNVVTN